MGSKAEVMNMNSTVSTNGLDSHANGFHKTETQDKGIKKPTIRVCVAGAGGFIGSHVAHRLKNDPQQRYEVIGADVKRNKYMKEDEFCHQFLQEDLRNLESCLKVTKGCKWVFNFAADMGGMGYIQSNQASILYNNTMITFNMLEAARRNRVKRYLFTSSACVYPESKQKEEGNPGKQHHKLVPYSPSSFIKHSLSLLPASGHLWLLSSPLNGWIVIWAYLGSCEHRA